MPYWTVRRGYDGMIAFSPIAKKAVWSYQTSTTKRPFLIEPRANRLFLARPLGHEWI